MKGFVCALLLPAVLAVWILGSPRTAWRVLMAFRPRDQRQPPEGIGYTLLRIGATLSLFSILVIIILVTRAQD